MMAVYHHHLRVAIQGNDGCVCKAQIEPQNVYCSPLLEQA